MRQKLHDVEIEIVQRSGRRVSYKVKLGWLVALAGILLLSQRGDGLGVLLPLLMRIAGL